jgi:hypothetical protein
MKKLVVGLFGVWATMTTNWELGETGLCGDVGPSCPQRTQRYGVCCEDNRVWYLNYCVACQAVLFIFILGMH